MSFIGTPGHLQRREKSNADDRVESVKTFATLTVPRYVTPFLQFGFPRPLEHPYLFQSLVHYHAILQLHNAMV